MTCTGDGGSVTKSLILRRDSNDDDDTEEPQQPAPTLILTSDLSTLVKDQGTRIRWSATDATACNAIGGWTSRTGTTDKHWISSIDNTTTYQMTCTGDGGSVTRSVTLIRDAVEDDLDNDDDTEEPQQPAPTLTLTSDLTLIDSNGSTTIRWVSNNATRCNAENNWSSKTDATGKQYIGSIENTTSYTMTCIGNGGSISKSVLVTVSNPEPTTGSVELNWSAPATNQDGCLLYTSPSPRDQRGSRMPSSA